MNKQKIDEGSSDSERGNDGVNHSDSDAGADESAYPGDDYWRKKDDDSSGPKTADVKKPPKGYRWEETEDKQ